MLSTVTSTAHVHEQAEKALKQRKWAEAEEDYVKALWVEPTANAVNLAFWLGLCQAQLALKKGAEAVKSCTAVSDRASRLLF